MFALHARWTDLGFDRALRANKGDAAGARGIARHLVPRVVQTAENRPLMHTVRPGNVAETKTLQGMLQRFPVLICTQN